MTRLTLPAPTGASSVPHDRSQRFVLVEVTAPLGDAQQRERRPSTWRSSSTARARWAARRSSSPSRPSGRRSAGSSRRDRFSVVVYDDRRRGRRREHDRPRDEARRNAIGRLATIDARGSTDLVGGWLRGCEQVAAHLTARGRRPRPAADRRPRQQGHHRPRRAARHAARAARPGRVDDDVRRRRRLRRGAAPGAWPTPAAATSTTSRDAAQIRDHIASEVGETLEVVARDVELEVLAGEGVRVEAISPQPSRPAAAGSIVALGDLVADQVLDVVLRLTFPFGELGRETGHHRRAHRPRRRVRRGGGRRRRAADWTWADDAANDAQPRDARGRPRRRDPVRRPGPPGGRAAQPCGRLRGGPARPRGDGQADQGLRGPRCRPARGRRLARIREPPGRRPMSARLAKEMYSDSYYEARSADPMGRCASRR